MLLDSEAPAQHWKTIRVFGAVICVGGFVLTALPLVVQGRDSIPLNPFIVLGPFFVVVGAVIYVWAAVGGLRAKKGL